MLWLMQKLPCCPHYKSLPLVYLLRFLLLLSFLLESNLAFSSGFLLAWILSWGAISSSIVAYWDQRIWLEMKTHFHPNIVVCCSWPCSPLHFWLNWLLVKGLLINSTWSQGYLLILRGFIRWLVACSCHQISLSLSLVTSFWISRLG